MDKRPTSDPSVSVVRTGLEFPCILLLFLARFPCPELDLPNSIKYIIALKAVTSLA